MAQILSVSALLQLPPYGTILISIAKVVSLWVMGIRVLVSVERPRCFPGDPLVDAMTFHRPVQVGDQVSCYCELFVSALRATSYGLLA